MIETDERLKSFVAKLEERPSLDVKSLTAEAIRLLNTIPTVRLDRSMEENRIRLSANQTRLVGIKLQCYGEHAFLTRARAGLSDHLHSRYGQYLRNVNTERGRSALVNKALAPLDKRIGPIKTLLEMLDIVLDDYRSRGFAFRDTVAALKGGERE